MGHVDDRLKLASVLVVDNDAETRETVRELLVGDGYQTATARDGREALEIVARGPGPFLLLLDLQMEGTSGFDVLETLRKDLTLPKTFVVVMTALPVDGRDLGNALVLRKPFDIEELLVIVARNVLRVRL
jgi:CheY-like chemotaxis protein